MDDAITVSRGHLLLADVSGYTAFLSQSELDHAQDILRSLFNVLLGEVRSPWRVCEVEGDAVFVWAPEGTIVRGQTVLEVMERLYAAFAGERDQMQRNTSCTCTACRLISELDLKLVAHSGSFVLQRLAGQGVAKPSGPDVILAHRLLKNTIEERTGISAYAFISAGTVDALELQEAVSDFPAHSEEYPHLGRIDGYVYDLHPFWAREKEMRRVRVEKEDAWLAIERELAAPPQVVWGYLNDPEHKRRWRHADEVRVFAAPGGRRTVGTSHHCVHGDMVIQELVVDWRPFDYFTCEERWPMDATTRSTTELASIPGGTRLTQVMEKPRARGLRRAMAAVGYVFLRRAIEREQGACLDRLRELVDNETVREPATADGGATATPIA